MSAPQPPKMTPQQQAARDAAMILADDIESGKVDVSNLAAELDALLRPLIGVVVGPADAAWSLQLDIGRQVFAMLPDNERAEWLAVWSHRGGETAIPPAVTDYTGSDAATDVEPLEPDLDPDERPTHGNSPENP